MAVVTTNLGVITAYGDAVAAGYTGTKAQWQSLMASYATVVPQMATMASDLQDLDGRVDELDQNVNSAVATVTEMRSDVSTLKSGFNEMRTATTSDVGKALKAKTVTDGKVVEWEFGGAGGGGSGQDGFSPTVTVTNITGGHRVSITDVNGTKTFDVMDGTDGFSPTVTVTNITNGHRVSVTDATGTKTFDVMNGSGSGGGSSVNVDDTLTISGDAADAKATGDKINDLDSRVTDIELGGTSSIGEFLGNTPITLTEDSNIKLVATQTTEYDLGSGTVADFSKRKNVALQNVSLTVNNEYTEVAVTGEPSAWYSAYASMTFDGFQIGEEYTITIDPLGSQNDLIAGGTFYFLDTSETALADPIICMDEVVTQTFTATTTSVTLQLYPVNSSYWDDNYRTARFKSMTITGRLKGSFNGTVSLGNIASGTTITSTPSCKVYAVEDTSVYKSRHAGKTCVCFGDSVTGFMSPPNDYPSVLAQLTGMTVYNVGFGGCRMSDTHPYAAYKRFGMCALVDAIVSGDWTEQDQYVDQIEAETFPQVHLNTLKRIDWNSVDFVTIFYGGNDAGNDVAIGTAGSSDTQTMVGALKYSVEKLLTAYPHLKILVLTQIFRYWMSDNKDSDEMEFTMGGQTYHYYDWGDEEIKAAQLLKVPVVDMYRTLGINSITRTLYLRASDQTHPSAEGNRLIAGKIAGKLLSEY